MKSEPRVLGEYRLLESIGRGGQGEVLRARHVSLQREVAIKVLDLDPVFSQAGDQRARFMREIKIHSSLSHPRLVKVLDAGVSGDVPYLAMELLQGPTLEQLLDDRTRLSSREARQYTMDMVEGLEYLHQRGILHRDLKPRNVIVDDRSGLKILDFGLARASTGTVLTAAGAVVGTVLFLAPEIITGSEHSTATDAYALGVIVYRMVTGQYPFELKSIDEHASDKLGKDPTDVRLITPEADPRLAGIAMGLLAREPEQRLPLSEVRKLLTSSSQSSPGEVTLVRPPPPRRTRLLAAGASMVLAAAVAAWALSPRPAGPERTAISPAPALETSTAPPSPPRDGRRKRIRSWHTRLYGELLDRPAGQIDGTYWSRLLVQLAKATRAPLPSLDHLSRSLEGKEGDAATRRNLLREVARASRSELVPLIEEAALAANLAGLELEDRWQLFECAIPLNILQKQLQIDAGPAPEPPMRLAIPGFASEPAPRPEDTKERHWTAVQTYLLNADVDRSTLELLAARWMTEKTILRMDDPERRDKALQRHHTTALSADLRNQRRISFSGQTERLELWLAPSGKEDTTLLAGDVLWVTLPSCAPFPLDWTGLRPIPIGRTRSPRMVLGQELPPGTLGEERTVTVRINRESMLLPRPADLVNRTVYVHRVRVGYL